MISSRNHWKFCPPTKHLVPYNIQSIKLFMIRFTMRFLTPFIKQFIIPSMRFSSVHASYTWLVYFMLAYKSDKKKTYCKPFALIVVFPCMLFEVKDRLQDNDKWTPSPTWTCTEKLCHLLQISYKHWRPKIALGTWILCLSFKYTNNRTHTYIFMAMSVHCFPVQAYMRTS